jgi:carbon storage regulator
MNYRNLLNLAPHALRNGFRPMLVLTRKIGESIKINEDVKITVIDVKGKNIRLGIEAPRETKVYREEVFLRIKEENKSAATSQQFDLGKISQLIKDKLKNEG